MSSLSLKFSKAAKLFESSIWHWFLISSSYSFLRLNLSTSKFCVAFLLTANLSLTLEPPDSDQYHSQLPWNIYVEYTRMPSPIYQYMIIWFCVFPSGEFQVYLKIFPCWNIVLLTTRFFDVAKFTILTPLLLLLLLSSSSSSSSSSWCRLPFPLVGLKILFIPTFVGTP